jgi:NAD(P)-dependent dehydrogenase (short-subunit alcohol dehydrogenase family)
MAIEKQARFFGRTLLVTGGGSGLGEAIARRFAAEGGAVAVVDRDAARAGEVAGSLPQALALETDVADPVAVREAVAAAARELGGLDCIVNAAGHVTHSRFERLALDDWDRMLAVHVTGTMLVCQAAVPVLRERGGGAIVNVSSTAALVGRPHLTAYSTAKAAILGLSRQLAVDLAAFGIRVNVCAPGDVRTPATVPLYAALAGGDAAAGEARIGASNLLGRVGEPHEIAAVTAFLLSDEAAFLTGAVWVPDGGVTVI